ncbi:MAG TPA: RNA-binding protein [Cyanobacteria bacterium UBA11049]|nr:RNA-binding protein [Cyanobacteria bacterium UBA11049]
MSIYIGNLPDEVTKDDLGEVLSEYGTVKRIELPVDRETRQLRGFGFVEINPEEVETTAIEALDSADWMGRSLKVSKARPREERTIVLVGTGETTVK